MTIVLVAVTFILCIVIRLIRDLVRSKSKSAVTFSGAEREAAESKAKLIQKS